MHIQYVKFPAFYSGLHDTGTDLFIVEFRYWEVLISKGVTQ